MNARVRESLIAIQLKNVHISEHLSRQSTAFAADLFIDGNHVAVIKNNGSDRHHVIYPLDSTAQSVINKAKDFKTIPVVQIGNEVVKMTFDRYISMLVEEVKVEKRIEKVQCDHIVHGTPGNQQLFKLQSQVSVLMKSAEGRERLRFAINEVKNMLKPGERILNTNIPTTIK